jgi:hypothetical protein
MEIKRGEICESQRIKKIQAYVKVERNPTKQLGGKVEL